MKLNLGLLASCLFLCTAVQGGLPPAPLQNYCPVVIVDSASKTNTNVNEIYFVAHGVDPNGRICFLVPNTTTGICSYVYPTPTGSPSSASVSVPLSSLPLATGTSQTDPAYLIYLPQTGSARAYVSINNPMYLATVPGAAGGNLKISDASVTAYNDPNFYTLYQDFEFVFNGSLANSSTQVFLNLSYVDYFCLPMQSIVYSYPSNTAYNNLSVTPQSGIVPTTPRETVMSNVTTYYTNHVPAGSETAWPNLGIAYYTNPYTASSPSTNYVRMLAAKNSLGLSTSPQFMGAVYPQAYFPSDYFSQSTTGPVASQSFMTTLSNYYSNPNTYNPFYFQIFPAGGISATTIYEMTASSGTLTFTCVTGGGPTFTVSLASLTAEELFSGGNWPFVPAPTATTVVNSVAYLNSDWTDEISKCLSALFSIGELPYFGTTSMGTPFQCNNTMGVLSFYGLTYFVNPFSYTYGPWFNLYDEAMHTQFINTGTVPGSNPTLGLCYAYDYDDLLSMSGGVNPLFQDNYGNPVGATSTPAETYSDPYLVITLGSLAGTVIPNLSQDTYTYAVTLGAAPNGVAVSVTYYTSSTSGTTITSAPESGTTPIAAVYAGPGKPFLINFVFNGVTYTYNVDLQHQIVTPTSTTSNYSNIDQFFSQSVTFTPSGGTPPTTFTLEYTSSPPPWPG